MNDRELLEYAAKAAGIGPLRCRLDDPMCKDFLIVPMEGGHTKGWNPLTDDGDALRLAVKLELTISCAWVSSFEDGVKVGIEAGVEQYAATRRALVRAAAEIGKVMK